MNLYGVWLPMRDADPRGFGHYMKHYSSRKARLGREHKRWQRSGRRYIGNGEHIALITLDGLATWAWRRQDFRKDDNAGIECSIFRNTGPCPSSGLVDAATAWAHERWPGYPLFTICTATLTRGGKRLIRWGECFWHAGWKLMHVEGLRFCWALEWSEANP